MFNIPKEKHPMFGRTHSDEAKRKIGLDSSLRNKGENNPNFGKGLHGEEHPMFGKHHSEETCKKISEANTGKPRSEEAKNKIIELLKDEYVCEFCGKITNILGYKRWHGKRCKFINV